jgi:site-specific DNA-methyltransferase (adenine-specific)
VRELEIADAAHAALLSLLAQQRLELDLGYPEAELLAILRDALTEPDPEPDSGRAPIPDGHRLAAALRLLTEAPPRGGLALVRSGGAAGPRIHLVEGPVERARPSPDASLGRVEILHADNLEVLPGLPEASFRLIYIDPPFNTGRAQVRKRLRTRRVTEGGDRTGFHGARYATETLGQRSFGDAFADYVAFLEPRLQQAHRLLTPDGSLFLHLDYREVHYAKVLLDGIFGRDAFINEIIWAYDYGARSRTKWSAKHDNILWYAKDPKRYVFHHEAMDRIPYMAPGLVGPAKAARGKTPTDVWWHTIVSPGGKERTGYPTQKPLGILRRLVHVHSDPGDALLDFFAGSGSFGEAGAEAGRDVTLIDRNPEAIEVMGRRLARFLPEPPVSHSPPLGDLDGDDGQG